MHAFFFYGMATDFLKIASFQSADKEGRKREALIFLMLVTSAFYGISHRQNEYWCLSSYKSRGTLKLFSQKRSLFALDA